ncbi:hypothetical protein [Enterococcus sp. CWB-B31]|uniref:hypothetical protein n=1 Tax=Enterococcus sp. CWB-B31 TaxID=2885159 RepID=UPI001E365E8D|nr:hypothetical protein [Enterococcus sp. CWB-B31]MCB5954485.1 hypothetical protein [Enterococcus sp. CWB-B31]
MKSTFQHKKIVSGIKQIFDYFLRKTSNSVWFFFELKEDYFSFCQIGLKDSSEVLGKITTD